VQFSAVMFVRAKEAQRAMNTPKNIKEELTATEDFLSDLDSLSETYEEERNIDKLLAQHGFLGQEYEEEQYN